VIFYVQYWLKKTLITQKNIYLNNQEDSLQKLIMDFQSTRPALEEHYQ
jgi:hypothetical protein